MFLPQQEICFGMKKVVLIALILLTLGAIIVAGAVVYELTIPGNVVVIETPSGDYEVKAYLDAACTTPLTNIDWGTMQCGETKTFTFYLKNTGSQKITDITIETVTSAGLYGSGCQSLEVGEVRQVYAGLFIRADTVPGSYPVTIEIECTA